MKIDFYDQLKKIFYFLNNSNIFSNIFKKKLKFILILVFLITVLEIIGIGLVIPFLIFILGVDQNSIDNNILNKILILSNFDLSKSYIILSSVLFITFIYFIKNFLIFKFYKKIINFTYNIQVYLSNAIYNNYLNYKFLNLKNISTAEVIRNITSETNAYVSCLQQAIILINEFLILIILLILMFLINFKLTFVILLFYSLILFFFSFFLKKKITLWGKQRIKSEQLRLDNIQKTFKSLIEIKIYNIKDYFVKQFNKSNTDYSEVSKKQDLINYSPRLTLEIILIFTISIIVLFNYFSGSNIDNLVIIITTFGLISFRMMPSINRLIMAFQTIRFYEKSLDKILLIFESKNIDEINTKKKLTNLNFIEFKNISYKYQDSQAYLLKDINLSLKLGDHVGIKGKSGSGKTTLINILLNLIGNYEGDILFDQSNVKILDIGEVVSYVPQKIAVVNDSILNNIYFGNNLRDEERALNLIKKLELTEIYEVNQNQNIGEIGTKISGGQEQRIALARALYRKPKLLILDESTNSLDKFNEDIFFSHLKDFDKEMIILNISHNNNSLKNCNKIYELKDGALTKIK